MKKLIIYSLILTLTPLSYAQLSTAPTSEAELFANAKGGSPMLNLVLYELRTKKPNTQQRDKVILGSPYLNEKFIASKIYYDKEFVGDYYARYNALTSEIEIKKFIQEKKILRLLPDKQIRLLYGTRELRFTTIITKKKETKNGYLSTIHSGKSYRLYHRLAIKYVEGKAAANSMVNPIPSRYAPFEEYYIQIVGINRINQLTKKKNKLLKQLKKEHKERVKLYLKKENINLNKEEQLLQLFQFLNTL